MVYLNQELPAIDNKNPQKKPMQSFTWMKKISMSGQSEYMTTSRKTFQTLPILWWRGPDLNRRRMEISLAFLLFLCVNVYMRANSLIFKIEAW